MERLTEKRRKAGSYRRGSKNEKEAPLGIKILRYKGRVAALRTLVTLVFFFCFKFFFISRINKSDIWYCGARVRA